MVDMLTTIVPKSDQMNSDDLIGRSITIKVTKVSLLAGEQPIAINYEGDNGKPYKPGKSMRRVLVSIWGADGNAYVGRSMTLYRDDKVAFGGLAVGGIRISHMSHINSAVTLVLTASKANKKPFTVSPLMISMEMTDEEMNALRLAGVTEAKKGFSSLKDWWSTLGGYKHKQLGASYLEELKDIATLADNPDHIEDMLGKAPDGDNSSPDEPVSLVDRVNSMVAEISMDKEAKGTEDYRNVTETEEFRALWAEIRDNKELKGKISAVM